MDPQQALTHWGIDDLPRPCPDPGNINHTWLVGDPPQAVLQRVNPIFAPEVNLDIQAVGDRLAGAGIASPKLLPTSEGGLWCLDQRGHWRLLSYLPGRTVHKVTGPSMAAALGRGVGAFHRGLEGWDHSFRSGRTGVHDTPAHMKRLEDALEEHPNHPLFAQVEPLAHDIFASWERWGGTLSLPLWNVHGDLKVSNLRFEGEEVTGILDLDTVGHMPISVELGDAWRSWCNPTTEDDFENTRFDLEIFEASLVSWLGEAPALSTEDRASLVPAIERICLELSSRFCADALNNSYFYEDRGRFPEPGQHCLVRARGQWALAQSVQQQRSHLQAIVERSR